MFEKLTGPALPSLNALRAFEAMARTGGATAAAAELCVTHSAISRQVKALEASLGVRLFDGPKHRLRLTEPGQKLLQPLSSAFETIASGVASVRRTSRDLNLAVHPSLAVKWLVPRLSSFSETRPDIEINVAELAPQAMSHLGADAVLRIVDGHVLDDPRIVPFLPNAIGPVLAPGLLASVGSVLAAPRLVCRPHEHGWRTWSDLAGVELPKVKHRSVAHLHIALDAALSGWGAAVLPWPLVAAEVLAGRLLAPLGFVPDGGAFVLIRASGIDSPTVGAFERWLLAEGASFPAPPQSVS